MKRPRKIVKTYRLQPHLVKGVEQMSKRMKCTKTHVLEYALARFILEENSWENMS